MRLLRSTYYYLLGISVIFGFRQSAIAEENVLTAAVLKTMAWADDLGSYELEINATLNNKSTSETSGSYSQVIDKIREFRAADGRFHLALASGGTIISTREGTDWVNETLILQSSYGNKQEAFIRNWADGGKERSLNCGAGGCADTARSFALCRAPLYKALMIPKEANDADVDGLLDLIFAEKNFHVSNTDREGRSVIVYRFKKRMNDIFTFAYRITVSDEGDDKGLILEISRFQLRKEQWEQEYKKDDQVYSGPENSSSIKWKEFETSQGKRVCPIEVIQTDRHSVTEGAKKAWTLDWKSFDAPDETNMNYESTRRICVEFGKDIDRVLRR